MVTVEALVCVRCGGPLARVTQLPAMVDCTFCGAIISVARGAVVLSREATRDEQRVAERARGRGAFHAALVELLRAGRSPYDALREASAAHLGTAGETETVARVSLALARDFEREAEASAVADPNVLARIALGYLQTIEALRDAPTHELNLPFLTATATGPKHLSRTLTPAILAELARRDPGADAGAPAAAPAAPAQPETAAAPTAKKKRFWLF